MQSFCACPLRHECSTPDNKANANVERGAVVDIRRGSVPFKHSGTHRTRFFDVEAPRARHRAAFLSEVFSCFPCFSAPKTNTFDQGILAVGRGATKTTPPSPSLQPTFPQPLCPPLTLCLPLAEAIGMVGAMVVLLVMVVKCCRASAKKQQQHPTRLPPLAKLGARRRAQRHMRMLDREHEEGGVAETELDERSSQNPAC